MKTWNLVIIAFILSILLVVVPASGKLKLTDRHPDEPAQYTFNKRFSLENSLSNLGFVKKSLESFRNLTDQARGKLSEKAIAAVGNTGFEIQNMAFFNWIDGIEGTLRKQDYQIKKLEYELAREKAKAQTDTAKELQHKKKLYEKAEADFQKFWNSHQIRD